MLSLVPKFYGILKKICITFTVFMVALTVLFHFFHKDKRDLPSSKNSMQFAREKIYQTINDPELQKTPEGKNGIIVYKAILCNMIGEGCTNNIKDGDKYFSRSIFGSASNLITIPFVNPPASGVWWAQNQLQNAGFVPQTYAAEGLGFASLKPLFHIWKILRDLTYIVLVVIMIAIGFMIMFRVKLDSQTVISIESVLPRLVVSLLLITFSFAIAGFLVDLMYVLMAVIISLFSPFITNINASTLQDMYMSATPGTILSSLFPFKVTLLPEWVTTLVPFIGAGQDFVSSFVMVFLISSNILNILPDFVKALLWFVGLLSTLFISGKIVDLATPMANLFNNIAGATFSPGEFIGSIIKIPLTLVVIGFFLIFIVPFILTVVILLTLFFLFFRIFFMLFISYLRVLFYVMFAPIFMLLAAIPGQNTFSYWIKNLIAELITFPLVTGIFLIGNILVSSFNVGDNVTSVIKTINFYNNNVQPLTPPYLYGIDQTAYVFLLSMGILFIIPEVVDTIRSLFQVKESPLKLGLGTFFGAGSVITGGFGILSSIHAVSGTLYGTQHSGVVSGIQKGINWLKNGFKGEAKGD